MVRQLESEDGYLALDLLQAYVNTLVLRKSSKRKAYSVVKSFFIHNRRALPPDPSFRIRGDTPPVQAKLTTEEIADGIAAANLRNRSMILFEAAWLGVLRRIGKISKIKGPPGSRYGYNLHEMRDEATTRLHTHAKNRGFNMDCAKLWCGQVGEIDPLKYDKFYRDTDYVRQQYLLAESCLNIVSNPLAVGPEEVLTNPQFIESLVKNKQFLRALKEALRGV